MIGPMADALSSAGLLLAALALVFGAWTPSIESALNKTFSPGEAAKKREMDEIRSIRNRRASPLAIGSWLIAVAFVPRDLVIIRGSVGCAASAGSRCSYDDVAAVFLLTQLLIGFLAWHVTVQAGKLGDRLK